MNKNKINKYKGGGGGGGASSENPPHKERVVVVLGCRIPRRIRPTNIVMISRYLDPSINSELKDGKRKRKKGKDTTTGDFNSPDLTALLKATAISIRPTASLYNIRALYRELLVGYHDYSIITIYMVIKIITVIVNNNYYNDYNDYNNNYNQLRRKTRPL
jgi:hypothetical protein